MPGLARFAAAHRRLVASLGTLLALVLGVWGYSAYVGAPAIAFENGILWFSMRDDAPWLPTRVKASLETPFEAVTPGRVEWRSLQPGFDVAELPVVVGGIEHDRVYLTRIDPARFRFIVRNDPANSHTVDDWLRDLHAVAAINGSYFGRDFRPSTPVVIDGARSGPADYDAQQGMFIATAGSARIQDLAHANWREVIRNADSAMVSYPMLIDANGQSRAPSGTRWLASRSFVAQDHNGMIILGSAPRGFFTLERLADFLRRADLNIALALNLDGGPVACQGVAINGYRRVVYGELEMQASPGIVRTMPTSRVFHATLPMVLAVVPASSAR